MKEKREKKGAMSCFYWHDLLIPGNENLVLSRAVNRGILNIRITPF